MNGWKGCTVSLFPVGKEVRGMISSGLKWPLAGLKWKPGFYGISNLVVGDELFISIEEGDLLLIKNNFPDNKNE